MGAGDNLAAGAHGEVARYAVISPCPLIATVVTVRVGPAGCVAIPPLGAPAVRSDEAAFSAAGDTRGKDRSQGAQGKHPQSRVQGYVRPEGSPTSRSTTSPEVSIEPGLLLVTQRPGQRLTHAVLA